MTLNLPSKFVALVLFVGLFTSVHSQTTIVEQDAVWGYLDNNTRPAGWPVSHDATAWSTGAAPLGYSNSVTTVVSFGPNSANKYVTTYFNHVVDIPNSSIYGSYTLNLRRDDGAIVYINGREAVRSNMPNSEAAHGTYASSVVNDGAQEIEVHSYNIPANYFTSGDNVISLELHQVNAGSSDLSFTIEILGNGTSLNTNYINFNDNWKFLDNGTNQGTTWRNVGFNDATWSAGHGSFGYGGSGGHTTTINFGPDGNNKYITTYFRKIISIDDPSDFANFRFNVYRDDGVAVYINGVERYLSNLTTNPGYLTLATNADDQGNTIQTISLSSAFFTSGENTIAVELHQSGAASSDLKFDLELIGEQLPPPPAILFDYGATWRYRDLGTNEGTAWRAAAFDDDGWKEGPAKFGYGDPVGTGTVVFSGCGVSNYPDLEELTPPNCGAKYITTYFRKEFDIFGLSAFSSFTFNTIRDDGYVIYINGTEVARGNMPAGTIGYTTPASSAIGVPEETTPTTVTVNACSGVFVEGTNVIAVEIHQDAPTSSDIGFDMQMVGNLATGGTLTLTRQPYLQMGRETAITLRWRTNLACAGRVEVGTTFGTYTTATVDETCLTTEHEVTVTGLTADTKYFYRIGTSDPVILQATPTNFFTTVPPANTNRKTRFAVFGDCGRNDNGFQSGSLEQYQNYLSGAGIDAADAMILLGDNAYNEGTDAQYTSNFYGAYGSNILRNHKLYPSPGNHDYNNGSEPASRTLAYYQNFTMPTNGEIGGVPSGTEAFYSYDIGDIHFLSLDSYGTETGGTQMYDTTGPQVTWVKADLAATNKKWVIAYWHHPPYTKGSHDSDSETDLRDIRENFIRILERNGVDMILCGHSHDYERSYLLKGYYKTNPADAPLTGSNFNVNTHAVNSSNGKYNGTANSCVYTTSTGKNHHGTVYVLSGSSGADGGIVAGTTDPWPHNAMPNSIDDGGMFYFEVEDNRLDGKFISRLPDGSGFPNILDQFTIMKDVNRSTLYSITNGSSITLTASWLGSYMWTSPSSIDRAITVTPPGNTTTNYTVSDEFGCLADQFAVTANGVLPVSVFNYDAKLNVSKVDVTWSTASESNNSYFTIERSVNGVNFSNIGTVAGAGTSTSQRNYTYVDLTPLFGVSYYRLSQTDFDANSKYLGVKRIVYNKNKNIDVKVVDTRNSTLALQIVVSENSTVYLRVYDILGREWKSERLTISTGINRKEVVLRSGIYIWEIRNDKGDLIRQKVVIP